VFESHSNEKTSRIWPIAAGLDRDKAHRCGRQGLLHYANFTTTSKIRNATHSVFINASLPNVSLYFFGGI